MSVVVRLEASLEPADELRALIDDAGGDGAVVSFVGLARPASKAGQLLQGLVLEHHARLTVQSLEEISLAAAQRFDASHVRVVHRYGHIEPGEAIVFAGAAAMHRRNAFHAADYLMDRLKTEAVFWKREVGERDEWIEPTAADYAARDRWR